MSQHGVGDVGIQLLMDQVEPRMISPIGVPQGERGIVRKAFSLLDILIQTTVSAICILEEEGMKRSMISRSIEGLFQLIATGYLVTLQLLLPQGNTLTVQSIE